jgi:hypothetical protein
MHKVDWALTRPGIGVPSKLLLVALAWITDDAGVTFMKQRTIGPRINKDERWVREYLPKLAEAKLITRYHRRRSNGSVTSDLIVLNIPRATVLDLSVYSGIIGQKEAGDVDPEKVVISASGEKPPVVESSGENLVDHPAETGGTIRRESAGPPTPLPIPQGEIDSPSGRTRASAPRDADRTRSPFDDLARDIQGILQRGIDGLTNEEPNRSPRSREIVATLELLKPSEMQARGAAIVARSIAQADNRAPNIAALFEHKLVEAMAGDDQIHRVAS